MKKIMTVDEFLATLEAIANVNTKYAKGFTGQVITKAMLDQKSAQSKTLKKWYKTDKSKQDPAKTNYEYLLQYADKGIRAYDCVCLVKSVLWGGTAIRDCVHASNGVQDMTCAQLYQSCTGKTNQDNRKRGMLMYLSGHVGVCLDDNRVIECAPSVDSVAITKRDYQSWTACGYLPWVDYESCTGATSSSSSSKPKTVTYGTMVVANCSALNCRSGASSKYGVVGIFKAGTKLSVMGQKKNGWYPVTGRTSNGKSISGWCSGTYLKEV